MSTGHCAPAYQSRLIQFVLDNLVEFSADKYASNVVETCIDLATPAQRLQAMQTICDIDAAQLHRFCTNATANYVVQKLLETASPDHIETLHRKIIPYFGAMERYVCGRKIIEKIKSQRNYQMNEHLPLALEALWL